MSPEARERSFDDLARGLASGSISRGKALKLMGAALVGGTLASIPGIAVAAPKPKPAGKKCAEDSQCQTGVCVNGVRRLRTKNAISAQEIVHVWSTKAAV